DPSEPTYVITPEAAAFGVTDEDQATQFVIRYQSGAGTYATTFYPTTAPTDAIHEVLDLTTEEQDRGTLTGAQARQIAAGLMARGKSQTRWTNGVTLDREQIIVGGVPAFLPTVSAGLMARAAGLPADFLTSAPWLD